MKRIVATTLLLLSLSGGIYAESPAPTLLTFNYSLEVGYLPLNSWMVHDTAYTGQGLDFYLTLKAEVLLLGFLFAGGSIKSDASFSGDGLNCDPSDIWYGVTAGLRFGGLEIGFRHMCIHPVMTYIRTTVWGNANAEGAYEELYISFKGSVDLFK